MGFFVGGGFDTMFGLVFILFVLVFLITMIKAIGQWNKNNNSPRLTVEATVVTKRIDVTHHHHDDMGNGIGTHITTSTREYVTFQVESGDRMEFQVDGREYGMLVEGDHGKLTFQGTRYLGFERWI
jgi:Na+-transporting methylmalonyl-CoA/oxaloacetate decarboxylase gamma subunit